VRSCFAVRKHTLSFPILVFVSACILQACIPAGVRPVSEQNKDTTGSYDGRWIAVARSTASTQHVGRWRMNCSDQKDNRYGPINVSNGEVAATLGTNTGKGFIDADGVFRLEIPTEAKAKETYMDAPLKSNNTNP